MLFLSQSSTTAICPRAILAIMIMEGVLNSFPYKYETKVLRTDIGEALFDVKHIRIPDQGKLIAVLQNAVSNNYEVKFMRDELMLSISYKRD